MKNIGSGKSYSKFLMTTYFYAIVILSLLIAPIYVQTIRIVRNNISSEMERNIQSGMNLFDSEIKAVHNAAGRVASSKDFLLIQNLDGALKTQDYLILKDFLYFFNGIMSFSHILSDACLIVSKNDIVVSDKQVFDDRYSAFDSLYSIKGSTLAELKSDLFRGQNINNQVRYDENFYANGEVRQSLVFFTAVSGTLTSHPDAVLMNAVAIDDFLNLINVSDVSQSADIVIRDNNEEVVYSSNADIRRSKASYFYAKSAEMGLTVEVFLGDAYYQENMASIKRIILLYLVFAVIIGIILALYFAHIQSQPLRNLVRVAESLTGTKDYEDRGYDYIKDLVRAINEKNAHLNDVVSKHLYEKLLSPGLSDAEYAEFLEQCPAFPQPYNIVVFRGGQLTPEIVELLLNKENIHNFILMTKGRDIVLFVQSPYDPADGDALYQKMLNISQNIRNQGLGIEIAISMTCESVYGVVQCWKNTLNMFKFMDYRHVIQEKDFQNREYNINIEENRKLYELIISGDAFSAKRIIYTQWYEILQNPSFDDQIEQLFLSQYSIINNAAIHFNYEIQIPKYDKDAKIDNLAYLIADVVDDLCACALKKMREHERASSDEIVAYVHENFSRINFGMNDLTERFKMSDKTIAKIVKQKTQRSLSKYLNELRMDKAKSLLSTTALTIASIAEACGFGTENAFYKAFKSAVGVSPGAYRRSHT